MGSIISSSASAVGSGYSANQVIRVNQAGNNSAQILILTVGGGGVPATYLLPEQSFNGFPNRTQRGCGYATQTGVPTIPASGGSGFVIDILGVGPDSDATHGFIDSLSTDPADGGSGGTGYVVGDTGTINQGGNSSACYRVAAASGGVVIALALDPGDGYSLGLATTTPAGPHAGSGSGLIVDINGITQCGYSPGPTNRPLQLIQISKAVAIGTTSITASFASSVTAGNTIVVIADDLDIVFGTAAPTSVTDSAGNSYSSIVSVQWNGGGGGDRKGIYAFAALGVLSTSSVTATFANDGNGGANRRLFIAEYSGVQTASAIDGFTSAGNLFPATSTVLTMTTTNTGTVNKTAKYTNADSGGGWGVVMFALATNLGGDLIIAATWAVEGGGPKDPTSNVSGLFLESQISPPFNPDTLRMFDFYFDPFGAGNRVFGGPSNQGPPG